MSNLNLLQRDCTQGNSAKKERRRGFVPGVLYGKEVSNLLFEIGEMELAREIAAQGQHGMINYSIGNSNGSALLKEVQRDPVTHKIIHIDLEEVDENRMIESEVPIHYTGEKFLGKRGAVLQKEKGVVRVSCKASSLPKAIDIDVSQAVTGSVFRYGDLEVGEEISILDDIKGVIASVSNEKRLVAELEEEEVNDN